MTKEERRIFGEFLRSRRERLTPQTGSTPHGRRRRTPGLRREEVAELAGLSVTWYTWIEQGREVGFTADVVERIADALGLGVDERNYLAALTGLPVTQRASSQPELPAVLRELVAHQWPYPAYAMGPTWEILAWNEAADWLFGAWQKLPARSRNLLWYTFLQPDARLRIAGWEERAARLIEEFRGDCGRRVTEPSVIALLAELTQHSPEFAAWWPMHNVHARDGGLREFNHPAAGKLRFEQLTLKPLHAAEIKLVVHVPADDATRSAVGGRKVLSAEY